MLCPEEFLQPDEHLVIGGVLAHLDDVLEFAQLFEHLLQAASSLTLSQCWSCC